jgi:hypothetical protein
MDPNPESGTAPAKTTPAWIKWALLTLLFTASLAGFFSNGLLFKKTAGMFYQKKLIPIGRAFLTTISSVRAP